MSKPYQHPNPEVDDFTRALLEHEFGQKGDTPVAPMPQAADVSHQGRANERAPDLTAYRSYEGR